MAKEKLQIAMALPGVEVPDWMVMAIETIVRSNHSEIAVLLIPTTKMKNPLLPDSNSFKHILYRSYLKSDKVKYVLSPDAFKKRKIKDTFDLPICNVAIVQKEGSFHLEPNESTKAALAKVSVLISFIGEDALLRPPRDTNLAVWSIQQAIDSSKKRGPAGVWEFLRNTEATGIAVTARIAQLGEEQILSTSYSSTDKFGLRRNRNNYLWKVPFMVERQLKRLSKVDPDTLYQKVRNTKPTSLASKQNFQYPNNLDILIGLASNHLRRFRKKINRMFNFEQYVLLFKMGSENAVTQKFSEFQRILPPKDRFWADPFILWKNGTYYIFIEELVYEKGLGTIGVIEMDKNGVYGEPKMVLEKDYHLSYPFLIEANNELYMIPESNANNTIQLYRCVDFPLKWELEEIIMKDVRALDTTIYFYNDKYWMFTNIKEHPGISGYDELFLFHSDKLVGGNWMPHPQNPIVSDVRRARPAGGIFAKNGKLYRPAQNCAKRYGYGMQIAEIKTLTETDYHEEIVQSIHPDWANDLRTTHTINHMGKLTVIDALIGRRK